MASSCRPPVYPVADAPPLPYIANPLPVHCFEVGSGLQELLLLLGKHLNFLQKNATKKGTHEVNHANTRMSTLGYPPCGDLEETRLLKNAFWVEIQMLIAATPGCNPRL